VKRITIYFNKDCARCQKIARCHKRFDWLNRLDTSTEIPRTGPPRLGEIVVEDARTGEISSGVDAVRRIFRQVPAYLPFLPLLWIPFFASRVDKEARGCADGSCSLPQEGVAESASGRA
jgi:hypothetical protein